MQGEENSQKYMANTKNKTFQEVYMLYYILDQM